MLLLHPPQVYQLSSLEIPIPMGRSPPYNQYNDNTSLTYMYNSNLKLAILMYFIMIAAIFLLILPSKYSIENGSSNFRVLRFLYILFLSEARIGQDQKM